MRLRRQLAVTVSVAAFAACAPAAAQAADCAAPAAVTTTTMTTTTTPVTTTTPTGVQTTSTTSQTPVTTTKPAKPVHPVAETLSFKGLFPVSGKNVTIPERPLETTVRVAPYVRGQQLSVTESVGSDRFKTVSLLARCLPGTDTGSLTLHVTAPRPGTVRVVVSHTRTAKLTGFRIHKTFEALNTNFALGTTGPFVKLVQQRLAALHIYIPQTGVVDLGTQLALDAYHRLLGDGEGIETLDTKTLNALLDGEGTFHVRYPGQGNHAEGDLSDQLLAFIDNGTHVHWIFPISSGKPSTPTILGQFQIYYKEPNYTSDGMYFSSFFHGGYAIHGYDPAPDYPASHGCMRLPMVDAIPAYGWTRVGDWVDTYYT